MGEAVPMTTPETAASRWIFSKIASVMAPLRPASWQVLARRERAAAGRGAYAICALPGGLRVPRVSSPFSSPGTPGLFPSLHRPQGSKLPPHPVLNSTI
jgi:hypothetical protein